MSVSFIFIFHFYYIGDWLNVKTFNFVMFIFNFISTTISPSKSIVQTKQNPLSLHVRYAILEFWFQQYFFLRLIALNEFIVRYSRHCNSKKIDLIIDQIYLKYCIYRLNTHIPAMIRQTTNPPQVTMATARPVMSVKNENVNCYIYKKYFLLLIFLCLYYNFDLDDWNIYIFNLRVTV